MWSKKEATGYQTMKNTLLKSSSNIFLSLLPTATIAASCNTTAQLYLINSVKIKTKPDLFWNPKLPHLLSYLVLWSVCDENELQVGHKLSDGGVVPPLEFVHYNSQMHPYLLIGSGEWLALRLQQRHDETLKQTWRWSRCSDLKKKNKETHREAGAWSNHVVISAAQSQEKILTLLLMKQRGDCGARRAKECKNNPQKSVLQWPHQHVLRCVASHGFFSALLMPV